MPAQEVIFVTESDESGPIFRWIQAKSLGLQLLIAEGYVEQRKEGQAHKHYSLLPYRAAEDEARNGRTVSPFPEGSPTVPTEQVLPTVPPFPRPYRGNGNGEHPRNGIGSPTVPLSVSPSELDLHPASDDEQAEVERVQEKFGRGASPERAASGDATAAQASEPDEKLIGVKSVLALGVPGLKWRQQLNRFREEKGPGGFPDPDEVDDYGWPRWRPSKIWRWARENGLIA